MNDGRIDAVIEWIATHPEQHDQNWFIDAPSSGRGDGLLAVDWECRTTACLAGWTVILDGWVPTDAYGGNEVQKGEEVREVGELARELLDLTAAQSTTLFYICGDLDDIRVAVAAVRAGTPDGRLVGVVRTRQAEMEDEALVASGED